jgi:protein TonB
MNTTVNTAVSLRAPGGSKTFKPKNKFGAIGVIVMVSAHLLIGYALATGLAQQAFQIIKKPLDATIIEEVKLPPPPPPPPPKVVQAKELAQTPPPAYVPPAEVAPQGASMGPTITAVQTTTPVAPTVAPVPTPVSREPSKTDIAVACPKQAKPTIPQQAIDEDVEGVVKAEIHIKGGKVVDVRILSGPRAYHASVKNAVSKYECNSSGDREVVATQSFTFKLN